MKNINIYVVSFLLLALCGCASNEVAYNASKYVINGACERSKNCVTNVDETYQENKQSNEHYQKNLAKEKEGERLKKAQEDIESKESKKSN